MAIADILSTVRNFVSSSSKTNNEFRNESSKNNRNISSAIRDISKMFQTQRAENAENQNSINEVLDITQATSRKTNDNNELLKQSISLQSEMLDQLKQISSGMSSLIQASQGGQQGGNSKTPLDNLLGVGAVGLGVGLTALPGVMNSFFAPELGQQDFFTKDMLSSTSTEGGGYEDTGGGDSGEKLSVAQMVSLAKEAGFSDEEAVIMAAIGAGESSGRTGAHNPDASTGDNSYGIWQINMLGKMGPERRAQFGIETNEELFDPKKNAAAAREIYEQQGFQAWSVYKSGAYEKYLGTAKASLEEKDENSAGANPYSDNNAAAAAVTPQSSAMGSGGGVLEKQHRLASTRTQPISDKLKSVLAQAAAAAGVDVVVYSGGQPSKASGKGPRIGSTRHDDGNAADLFLTKDGRKLSDTNPEDRAIMAKFVSAAVQAGATGVGAGHGYMGESNIHVGFGKPATWGGAPWIKSAASGVYNNEDLQSQGGSGSSAGGAGEGIGGSIFGGIADMFSSGLGMLGIGGIDIPSLLSSFFGLPVNAFTSGSDESKETVDDLFSGETKGEGESSAKGTPSAELLEDQKTADPNSLVADTIQVASLNSKTNETAESAPKKSAEMAMPQGNEREFDGSFGNNNNTNQRDPRAGWSATAMSSFIVSDPDLGQLFRRRNNVRTA